MENAAGAIGGLLLGETSRMTHSQVPYGQIDMMVERILQEGDMIRIASHSAHILKDIEP